MNSLMISQFDFSLLSCLIYIMVLFKRFVGIPSTLVLAALFLWGMGEMSPGAAHAAKPDTGFILAAPTGEIIWEKNSTTRLVPASTLKVLTALCAIETLGETFRFSTIFFLDQQGTLTIKGGGDPLLTSGELPGLAHQLGQYLKDRRVFKLRKLVLDTTFFAPDITIPGTGQSQNPYDAPVGALSVNFNTVAFQKKKTGGWGKR